MNQMATQISRIQQLKDAGRIGGKKFVALYGNPGTSIGRSMGGKNSWEKRKADPALYKKYANVPILPKESEHLAEFFGIILGDGNITRFQCAVYLNSKTDQKYSKFIVGLIKQLFGLNATISKHKADNVLRIVVSSADLVRFLLKNGLVLGNKVRQQAKVPSWILADKKYVRACLRGLMDTDGCLAWHNYVVNGKRYSYPKVIFSNRSENLLDFVYFALRLFDFHPKRTKHHQVWLYNQKEVLKYIEVIDTRNPKESFFKKI